MLEQAQQLTAAVCLFLATGCGDCLFAKTCRCNCPSNGANCETLFTCIQNPSCSSRSHPES